MRQTKIKNFSLEPEWKIYQWFDQGFCDKYLVDAVVLPDVCPAGLIPNGTVAVTKKEWLDQYAFREVISDIGCAMSLGGIPKFAPSDLRRGWNDLYKTLVGLKKTILGSGNHFIDAVVGEKGDLSILVHVGSRMTSEEKSRFKYQKDYQRYLERAVQNHEEIWQYVERVFGPVANRRSYCHDTAELRGNEILVRKGVVHAPAGAWTLIASSFEDVLILGVSKPTVSELMDSISHGTGRTDSRSEAKLVAVDAKAIRERVILPDDLADDRWRLEAPVHYRPLANVLSALENYVDIKDRLKPVAFMGGF